MASRLARRRPSTPSASSLTQSTALPGRRSFSSYFVTPAQLNEVLSSPSKSSAQNTIPICASWFLPNDPQKRTGYGVFMNGHIPNARFFDLDEVADTSSPYPHMLPSAETFQRALSKLGITRDDRLVVYDSAELGIFSAPRVAWTLKVFGHPSVHILNNFKLWTEQGLPVEQGGQEHVEKTSYPLPELDAERVAAFEDVKELAQDYQTKGQSEVQILDARSLGRWQGTEPEPRAGLSSGHMPGSISVPVPELLDPQTKTFLPADKLRQVFESKGIDAGRPIVSSCGTGVTAAVIDAALTEAGYGACSRRIYDGSWTEWAQRVQPGDNLIVKSD
ncbi:hypothetical protein AMS68_003317 [Peltaster fructicola]|uniref:Rhodanese domain-containing protein n=1 Tax=Peltaster fructicola TaxID=286661 RepID=A0A6H0XTL0_9PEZI|nr:hypothetical protein AMS68_003317 [Peltaster fructicola]